MIAWIVRLIPVLALPCIMGCYTQFATVDWQSVTPERRSGRDTGSVAARISDSLRLADDETCVWERDLMGFPYLRCYKGYYPREWYRNNFTPWWYQAGAPYHDGSRCPEYYYYDKTCGCCRYYLNNPELSRTARGITRTAGSQSPAREAADTVNRVNVTASTHTSATIPLRDGRPQEASPGRHITAHDSTVTKGAHVTGGVTHDTSAAGVSTTPSDSSRQTDGTAIRPVVEGTSDTKKPRRTTRGR